MQTLLERLRPAQAEVHRTARDQDLVEVPKRARLDRGCRGKRDPAAIRNHQNAATH